MKKNTWRKPAALGLLVWSVAFAVSQVQAQAQEVVLASNYDGTNYSLNGYNVGSGISGYTFSWGANFTVAGTGDFSLTHITMPLSSGFGGSSPQPLDFRFAIVADVAGHPDGEVVTTFLPTAPTARRQPNTPMTFPAWCKAARHTGSPWSPSRRITGITSGIRQPAR